MQTHLIVSVVAALGVTACGGQNPVGALTDSEFAEQISELGSIIDEMQGSASFSKDLGAITSKSSKDFVAKITSGLTDEAFDLGGLTFSDIKSKVASKSKAMTSLQAKITKTYKSPAGLFAAHGLGKKIHKVELADYFRVAKAGLTSLANGKSASDQFDSLTIARALHVAAALTTIKKSARASLALENDKAVFIGRFTSCGKASNVSKKKDYICAIDNVSGSIGYMSADRSNWIDGVSGTEFKSCGKNIKTSKDGWGWLPDPQNPKGGVSCHVNVQSDTMTYEKDEVEDICGDADAKKTNKAFCEKHQADNESKKDAESDKKDSDKKTKVEAEAKSD